VVTDDVVEVRRVVFGDDDLLDEHAATASSIINRAHVGI